MFFSLKYVSNTNNVGNIIIVSKLLKLKIWIIFSNCLSRRESRLANHCTNIADKWVVHSVRLYYVFLLPPIIISRLSSRSHCSHGRRKQVISFKCLWPYACRLLNTWLRTSARARMQGHARAHICITCIWIYIFDLFFIIYVLIMFYQ